MPPGASRSSCTPWTIPSTSLREALINAVPCEDVLGGMSWDPQILWPSSGRTAQAWGSQIARRVRRSRDMIDQHFLGVRRARASCTRSSSPVAPGKHSKATCRRRPPRPLSRCPRSRRDNPRRVGKPPARHRPLAAPADSGPRLQDRPETLSAMPGIPIGRAGGCRRRIPIARSRPRCRCGAHQRRPVTRVNPAGCAHSPAAPRPVQPASTRFVTHRRTRRGVESCRPDVCWLSVP